MVRRLVSRSDRRAAPSVLSHRDRMSSKIIADRPSASTPRGVSRASLRRRKLTALFDRVALDPVAREVVIMTVATRNACRVCVAMHTGRLTALGAGPDLIAALRDGPPQRLADERLEAIRVFTQRVLDTAGEVGEAALRDFLAQGYTRQNALEVVLGIGTYTMSTLANRLTGAPVDEPLAAFAWHPEAA